MGYNNIISLAILSYFYQNLKRTRNEGSTNEERRITNYFQDVNKAVLNKFFFVYRLVQPLSASVSPADRRNAL